MTRRDELEVTTGYLIEGLTLEGTPTAHQITLTTSAGQPTEGQLFVDPNRCTLDSFGDPQACTRIAVWSHPATLQRVEEQEGKELFEIKAEGYTGPPLRLALLPRDGAEGEILARLLVLGDDGRIRHIVTLEPVRGRISRSC